MAGTLTVQNIQGPASGANANKIIIPSGQTLDASAGGITLPAGVGGKVLQVVQGQTSTQVSTSVSASYTDTGLQASITPTSTSNKVLVIFNITVDYRTSTANFGAQIKLFRDATEISMDYVQGYYASSGTNDLRETRHHSQSVLDSPSTTSSVTYKVQGRAPTQTGGISEFNWNSSVSSITLMEIAG